MNPMVLMDPSNDMTFLGSSKDMRWWKMGKIWFGPDLAPTMSFWVSSDLDGSLYRWCLFVYFTFPWIWLDLRMFLTN